MSGDGFYPLIWIGDSSGQKVSSIDMSGKWFGASGKEYTQVSLPETNSSPWKSMLGSGVKCPFKGRLCQIQGELFFDGFVFLLSFFY